MLAFFTIGEGEVQQHENTTRIDSISGDYRITITIGGVSIFKKGELIFEQDLNLSGIEPTTKPKTRKQKQESTEPKKVVLSGFDALKQEEIK
ncbi:MAG: hypothetical protein WC389_10385 [Lutibacter sp.]|jgi:hypothetical protein